MCPLKELEDIVDICDELVVSLSGSSGGLMGKRIDGNTEQNDDLGDVTIVNTETIIQDLSPYQLSEKARNELADLYEKTMQRFIDSVVINHHSILQRISSNDGFAGQLKQVTQLQIVQFECKTRQTLLSQIEEKLNEAYGGGEFTVKTIDGGHEHGSGEESNEEEEEIEKEIQRLVMGGKRPGRKLFPGKTILILNTVYERERHPSAQVKVRLCRETGLTLRQITTWFQNSRSRIVTHTKQSSNTAEVSNVTVKKEVEEEEELPPRSSTSQSRSPSSLRADLLPSPPSRRTPEFYDPALVELPQSSSFFDNTVDFPTAFLSNSLQILASDDAFLTTPTLNQGIWNTFTAHDDVQSSDLIEGYDSFSLGDNHDTEAVESQTAEFINDAIAPTPPHSINALRYPDSNNLFLSSPMAETSVWNSFTADYDPENVDNPAENLFIDLDDALLTADWPSMSFTSTDD